MIEIPLQINPGYRSLSVTSQEDLEKLKAYSPNQVLRAKLTGHKRPRSVRQNNWIHAMFKIVSENVEDPNWATPEKVKTMVKMMMGFYEQKFIVKGQVYFQLRSFAFDSMDQAEADKVYNQAKEICAMKLRVDPEILAAQAKELPF